jgi:hypothetical protein
VVAVGVAAACAAADAAVVVGDVECGGGVEARDRCADRERRDEDEEDDDVDDAGDAAAADERCLDEPGLLERAGLRDGVSGGREGWTGSGAVAAVAAATMPSRVPRRGGAEIWLRAAAPRQCRSPGLQLRRLRCRSFSGHPCGGGRPPDRRRACYLRARGEAVLQFAGVGGRG